MFTPDYLFDTVYDISPEILQSRGVCGVFLDIDNTLVSYDESHPTPENIAWLQDLKNRGITPFFVSNNHKERVETFAKDLGIAFAFDAGKPSTKAYRKLADEAGIPIEKTVCIGDQLFTDVWSAHRLGVKCLVVKSIKPVKTAFFRFKTTLEKPFFALYKRKYPKGRSL